MITLDRPYSILPAIVADWNTGIISAANLTQEATPSVAGTGPYMVTDASDPNMMTLSANEAYWGTVATISSVEFMFVPDAQARQAMAQAGEATALSMLAFLYTATICFMFLTGLILIYTVVQDFSAIYADLQIQDHEGRWQDIQAVGQSLMCEIFRATVLGIAIATCIKLQATYLQSTGENIVNWLVTDARLSLGIGHVASGWLNQRSIAHFTSFLLLFSTCSVFFFGFFQIRRSVNQLTGLLGTSALLPAHRIRWWSMFSVVILLTSNFLLIGQFAGFSIMLLVSVLIAIYSIYDPTFGKRTAHIEAAGKA